MFTEDKILVIENFFSNPLSVRDSALKCDYFKCSEELQNNNVFFTQQRHNILVRNNALEKKIKDLFFDLNIPIKSFNCSFNLVLDSKPLNDRIHRDSCHYAGLVYLTPNPDAKTGTSFYKLVDEDIERDARSFRMYNRVDNVFNRAIFYHASNWHNVMGGFGETKHNGRLTLNFFLTT